MIYSHLLQSLALASCGSLLATAYSVPAKRQDIVIAASNGPAGGGQQQSNTIEIIVPQLEVSNANVVSCLSTSSSGQTVAITAISQRRRRRQAPELLAPGNSNALPPPGNLTALAPPGNLTAIAPPGNGTALPPPDNSTGLAIPPPNSNSSSAGNATPPPNWNNVFPLSSGNLQNIISFFTLLSSTPQEILIAGNGALECFLQSVPAAVSSQGQKGQQNGQQNGKGGQQQQETTILDISNCATSLAASNYPSSALLDASNLMASLGGASAVVTVLNSLQSGGSFSNSQQSLVNVVIEMINVGSQVNACQTIAITEIISSNSNSNSNNNNNNGNGKGNGKNN